MKRLSKRRWAESNGYRRVGREELKQILERYFVEGEAAVDETSKAARLKPGRYGNLLGARFVFR